MRTEVVTVNGEQRERIYDGHGALISDARYTAPRALPRLVTRREFIGRLGANAAAGVAKYQAMVTQSKYQAWRDYLMSGEGVDLDDPATVLGLNYAVQQGDLSTEDRDRVLA